MIDTIVLMIKESGFTILDHNRFKPSTRELFGGGIEYGSRMFKKYINNPPKADYKAGICKPRLTAFRRLNHKGRIERILKIEFSIPKLLYSNNVDEIEEKDFELIIKTLQERIKQMGVCVFEKALINADVSNIHFSKNIVFNDCTTSTMIINDLGKIDLTEKLELNKTHYKNDGHALYFYAKNHSIILYDKMADIEKAKQGRAVDNEKIIYQLELFEINKKLKRPNEILKFEIRLTQKQKLRSVLHRLGFEKELIFKNLFNQELAKKALNYYWSEYFQKQAYFLALLGKKPIKILENLLSKSKKKITIKNSLFMVGFLIISETSGIRGLRKALEKHYSTRSWYRFRDSIKDYFKNNNSGDIFYTKEISKQLEKFEPVRVFDLNLDTSYNVNKSKKEGL